MPRFLKYVRSGPDAVDLRRALTAHHHRFDTLCEQLKQLPPSDSRTCDVHRHLESQLGVERQLLAMAGVDDPVGAAQVPVAWRQTATAIDNWIARLGSGAPRYPLGARGVQVRHGIADLIAAGDRHHAMASAVLAAPPATAGVTPLQARVPAPAPH